MYSILVQTSDWLLGTDPNVLRGVGAQMTAISKS